MEMKTITLNCLFLDVDDTIAERDGKDTNTERESFASLSQRCPV